MVRKTTNLTITIPIELYARMKRHKEIWWSQYLIKKIEKFLDFYEEVTKNEYA